MFFVVMFQIVKISNHRAEIKLKKLYDEYPAIMGNDSVNNVILEIGHSSFTGFRETSGLAFVLLDNNRKCRINTNLNPNFNYIGINEIISISDKLLKKVDSDTIFLIKETETYFFILNDEVAAGNDSITVKIPSLDPNKIKTRKNE